jgi:hypothetical protein
LPSIADLIADKSQATLISTQIAQFLRYFLGEIVSGHRNKVPVKLPEKLPEKSSHL